MHQLRSVSSLLSLLALAALASTPPFAAHEDYHAPTDLPERLEPENLLAATRLLRAALAAYAWGDEAALPASAVSRAAPAAPRG